MPLRDVFLPVRGIFLLGILTDIPPSETGKWERSVLEIRKILCYN